MRAEAACVEPFGGGDGGAGPPAAAEQEIRAVVELYIGPELTADELTTLRVNEGYYRFSDTAITVYKCHSGHCKGGTSETGRESCEINRKGPLCSLCDDGYFEGEDGSCKGCSSSQLAWSLAWLIAADDQAGGMRLAAMLQDAFFWLIPGVMLAGMVRLGPRTVDTPQQLEETEE